MHEAAAVQKAAVLDELEKAADETAGIWKANEQRQVEVQSQLENELEGKAGELAAAQAKITELQRAAEESASKSQATRQEQAAAKSQSRISDKHSNQDAGEDAHSTSKLDTLTALCDSLTAQLEAANGDYDTLKDAPNSPSSPKQMRSKVEELSEQVSKLEGKLKASESERLGTAGHVAELERDLKAAREEAARLVAAGVDVRYPATPGVTAKAKPEPDANSSTKDDEIASAQIDGKNKDTSCNCAVM